MLQAPPDQYLRIAHSMLLCNFADTPVLQYGAAGLTQW